MEKVSNEQFDELSKDLKRELTAYYKLVEDEMLRILETHEGTPEALIKKIGNLI